MSIVEYLVGQGADIEAQNNVRAGNARLNNFCRLDSIRMAAMCFDDNQQSRMVLRGAVWSITSAFGGGCGTACRCKVSWQARRQFRGCGQCEDPIVLSMMTAWLESLFVNARLKNCSVCCFDVCD